MNESKLVKQSHRRIVDAGNFWKTVFSGDVSGISFPEEKVEFQDKGVFQYEFDTSVVKSLNKISKGNDLTLFTVLVTNLEVHLMRLAGKSEYTIGLPVYYKSKIQESANDYVVLKSAVQSHETFKSLLIKTKDQLLETYKNQSFDLAEVVDAEDLKIATSINIILKNLHSEEHYEKLLKQDSNQFSFVFSGSESELTMEVHFNKNSISVHSAGMMANVYALLLEQSLKTMDIQVGDLATVDESDEEKLDAFNDNKAEYPSSMPLDKLFEKQAEKTPNGKAVTFEGKSISYKELNIISNRVAWFLKSKGVGKDHAVGLAMERSIDMIVCLLGILKSGAAYLPIDINTPIKRIEYVLEDSKAPLVFCTSSDLISESVQAEIVEFSSETVIGYGEDNPEREYGADDLLYVNYTSGTTGQPKGVMFRHVSLNNLIHHQMHHSSVDFSRNMLQFATISFDVASQEIFSTLLGGGNLHLISDKDRKDVDALLKMIEKECITTVILPTAYFKLIASEDKYITKLSQLVDHIVVSGEQLIVEEQVSKMLHDTGTLLHNHYGPTETHVVTIHTLGANEQRIPPIGKPIANTKIHILDRELNSLPAGAVGEICVSGDALARGYLNRAELTAEKFVIADKLSGLRLYRTGDLGRWMPDGSLEFLGRIDHQVKIRGYRVELGEVESNLLKLDLVKEAIVIVHTANNESVLVAYCVGAKDIQVPDLKEQMLELLPEYMIPAHIIQLKKMPYNANGKVDRKALPAPNFDECTAKYVEPKNDIERTLHDLWCDVLNLEKVSVHDNFFDIGGHSLNLTKLLNKIRKAFDKDLSLQELFDLSTIESQGKRISEIEVQDKVRIPAAELAEYYPVSSAQKRMYLLDQYDKSSTAYNICAVFELEGAVDQVKIEKTFIKLIQRHESLRTSFHNIDGKIVQKINSKIDWELPITKMCEDLDKEVERFVKPFDLTSHSLLRTELLVGGDNTYLLLDMHHIISDAVSMKILMDDFIRLYSGKTLMSQKLQYKDYSVWHLDRSKTPEYLGQGDYWKNIFEADIPILKLPYDYNRSNEQSFEGNSISFELEQTLYKDLMELSKKTGTTMQMILLSAINLLLAKYSQQNDIVIGIPTSGRVHADMENLVGMFVNTLPLRNQPENHKTYLEFLDEVKVNALSAYENQEYPLESLLDDLNIERDTSRNPIFDVVFNLSDESTHSDITLNDLIMKQCKFNAKIAKFDLTFEAILSRNTIKFSIDYCTKLFKAETMGIMVEHFVTLLSNIVRDTGLKIGEYQLLTEKETTLILEGFNQSDRKYDRSLTVQKAFEASVKHTPDKTAVVYGNRAMTYSELDKKSNQLARKLQSAGVSKSSVVGLLCDKSLDVIVGILAVLKAGGTYLPIEPSYPSERVEFMIQDSKCSVLLCDEGAVDGMNVSCTSIVMGEESYSTCSDTAVMDINQASDPAYIIYTSGTTGKPKGVVCTHRNIISLIKECNYIDFVSDDKILQTGAIAFDASTFEIWGALLNSLELHMAESSLVIDPKSLRDYISENKITTLWLTAELFNQTVDELPTAFKNLRWLLSGGDILSPKHVNKVRRHCHNLRLVNGYGPTENTTFSTTYEIDSDFDSRIPIGKPIANSQAYILDETMSPLPLGVEGELYLAGDGIAMGYLNRPELTAEKFVDNPFKPGLKMYKTGDIARWLPDGNIDFIGRRDSQVKVRGFRIELSGIENVIHDHSDVLEAAVLVRGKKDNEKQLEAYYVSSKELEADQIRKYVGSKLPVYMLPNRFIPVEKMPLTRNGKLDRKELLKLGEQNKFRHIELPQNMVELKMLDIWKEHLGVDRLGVEDNFFEHGGNSLKGVLIVAAMHEAIDKEVSLKELFKQPTIRDLAKVVLKSLKKSYQPIERIGASVLYDASSAQKRMFMLQEFDQRSNAYNIPGAVEITGQLNNEKLKDVITQLVNRHEALRTVFKIVDGQIVQKIIDAQDVNFEIEEVQCDSYAEVDVAIEAFNRPFDLRKDLPFRAGLISLDSNRHVLALTMHHSNSDGMSMNILITELGELYAGKLLATPQIQYKDYACWQNQRNKSKVMQEQETYWLKEFEGEVPLLNLPTDWQRPLTKDYKGSEIIFSLGKDITVKLNEIASRTGSTMYMVLLASVKVLLSKLSSQDEIVVGSPIAGRNHSDLQSMVGMFVNTLAIKSVIDHDKSFMQYLAEIREKSLFAYENQEYQFEELVENLGLERDLDRNPLFDVMFSLQNMSMNKLDLDGLELAEYPVVNSAGKFDLTINAKETGEEIIISFGYATSLFAEDTVARFIKCFENIIDQICNDPVMPLKVIDMIPDTEKSEISADYNNTYEELNTQQRMHELFEMQVEKTPDNIAIVCNSDRMTYRELNEKSNQLARMLVERGVKQGDFIGVRKHRSVDLVVAQMACLKASAAYIPLEPHYPINRIDRIVENSNCKMILTDIEETIDNVQVINTKAIDYAKYSTQNLPVKNKPEDIAYIIYTSGSTGVPKGVVITHEACINTLLDINLKFSVDENDAVLCISSACFDLSVYDVFGTLACGAKIVLIEDSKNIKDIVSKLESESVTVWNSVPAFMELIVANVDESYTNDSLKVAMLSGDWISLKLPERVAKHFPNVDLYSLGGATEGSIWSIYYPIKEVKSEWKSIPYGYPLSNQQMYVLNPYGKQQPYGVTGEIFIGGHGVALEYANDHDKTSYSFIEHPEFGKIYRTGDLGIMRKNGYIEFLGRLDYQVKIRGFRIELEEIESKLLDIEEINEATLLVKGENEEKYLVAYYISNRNYTVSELREELLKHLPDYMIPMYFIKLDQMPLTANGKVNRKALPEPSGEIETGRDFEVPNTKTEKTLASIWRKILTVNTIGVHDNFFELGGHSLRATTLVSHINRAFDVEMTLKDVFMCPTIKEQANLISQQTSKDADGLERINQADYYKASSAQARIFMIQEASKYSVSYNIPAVMQIEGSVDSAKLLDTVNTLVARHESLRTVFDVIDGEVVQKVMDAKDAELTMEELMTPWGEDIESVMEDFVKPFDLKKDRSIRFGLMIKNESESCLMIDMHHANSDGVSVGILMDEFGKHYSGKALNTLEYQYKDYAHWQKNIRNEDLIKQKKYWLDEFSAGIPQVNLPLDYKRPEFKDFVGSSHSIQIDPITAASLEKIAKENQSTLYMVLLSGLKILVSKYTGQNEIVIGSPIAGRVNKDLEQMIGMFVNSIVIKTELEHKNTFVDCLDIVKTKALNAFENQEYPFENLVDALNIKSDLNRNPIFDIMFMHQNYERKAIEIEDLTIRDLPMKTKSEKLDLTVTAVEDESELRINFNYATSLFGKNTIEQMAKHYDEILKCIAEDSHVVVENIALSEDLKILDDIEFESEFTF